MARFETDWHAAQSRRRSRRERLRSVIGLLVVYLLVLCALFAVFRTPLLRVQAVHIEGATYTDPADVKNALMAERPGLLRRMAGYGNLFGWPTSLSSSTRALIPSVRQITITKSYFTGTITAHIVERQPVGIWCFSRTDPPVCQWFDEQGVVYSPALYTVGSLIPVVHDTAQDTAGEGSRVLPDRLLQNFLAVIGTLRDLRIPAREIDLADLTKEEVSIPTYGGPTFQFSLRFPPANVGAVLDDLHTKGIYGGLQLLDFRSENRVFYQ